MNKSKENYIRLFITIEEKFETSEIGVLSNVSIHQIIDHLIQKHHLGAGHYDLIWQDESNTRTLPPNHTIGQTRVPSGTHLKLVKNQVGRATDIERQIHANQRIDLPPNRSHIAKIVVNLNHIVTLQWYPAIIGRRDKDASRNHLLAVDLSYIPNANQISRQQACITYRNGNYYLHHLSNSLQTYLNHELLDHHKPYVLQAGDQIRLGKLVTLQFTVQDV